MSMKFASAVGAVRAMESSLLTHGDIEQLISAGSLTELDSLLSSKKIELSSIDKVWEMLREYAPESRELEILLYRNDFHNLKASLKAMIAGRDAKDYFITPSNAEPSLIADALREKDYDELPEYMRAAAEEAYELLTSTMDGQLSDSFIDAAALGAMLTAADKTGCDFMVRYARLTAACADIKTAYRCALMGKPKQFLETAVCGTPELPKDDLIRASLDGTEALFAYLETTDYSEASAMLKESPARFEKWCDDIITEHAGSARMTSFGCEPLAAYYIAKEAEIKNLRIIRVCRECGSDKQTVTERMRKLYV